MTRFAPMPLELDTERLELRLWRESDATWYRELVPERGVDRPTREAAHAKVVELRANALIRESRCSPSGERMRGTTSGTAD